ncbi:MAG TPA: rhodanese-like domain-containing protein [Burkholderiaceae bacterium]|nr:rhodanese-like domain-containing protein [Burkholderiaceae bacterium]
MHKNVRPSAHPGRHAPRTTATALALLAGLLLTLGLSATGQAQTAAAPAAAASAPVWKYQTQRLNRAQVDSLLARPEQIVVLDIRRPDELIKYGSFPAFVNIQYKDLEKHLAYLPRDRVIVTVSNHAQRAGAAGDLLTSRGFKVAGATGSEDYEQEGGQQVQHIQAPPPRAAAGTGAGASAGTQPARP